MKPGFEMNEDSAKTPTAGVPLAPVLSPAQLFPVEAVEAPAVPVSMAPPAESWNTITAVGLSSECLTPVLGGLPPPAESWDSPLAISLQPPTELPALSTAFSLPPPTESWEETPPTPHVESAALPVDAPPENPEPVLPTPEPEKIAAEPSQPPPQSVSQEPTMPEREQIPPPRQEVVFAWQPFTFRGVAAFAHASLGRLLLVQLLMAAMGGASVVWFVDRSYSPVILEAVQAMPETAVIRNGTLAGVSSQVLAEKKNLCIAVDMEQNGELGQSADLQVEMHEKDLSICPMFRSLTGVLSVNYPKYGFALLGRATSEPWWGAWHPIIYTGILLCVTGSLLVLWMLLATPAALFVRLLGYYADRDITLGGSWKLAAAALLPGALLMVLAIVLYGCQVLDLIGLIIFNVVHFAVSWIYFVFSPFFVPKIPEETKASNPFTF